MDVNEAAAMAKVVRSDLTEQMNAMSSLIAQTQQMMKGAQTTPPSTP